MTKNPPGFIRFIQRELNKHGFNLAVDGKFGKNTKAALKAFQASMGLKETGTSTKETVAALRQPASPQPSDLGALLAGEPVVPPAAPAAPSFMGAGGPTGPNANDQPFDFSGRLAQMLGGPPAAPPSNARSVEAMKQWMTPQAQGGMGNLDQPLPQPRMGPSNLGGNSALAGGAMPQQGGSDFWSAANPAQGQMPGLDQAAQQENIRQMIMRSLLEARAPTR